jgi:hypothetical protein
MVRLVVVGGLESLDEILLSRFCIQGADMTALCDTQDVKTKMKGLSVTSVVISKPRKKTTKKPVEHDDSKTPEETVRPMPTVLILDKDYILPWGRRKDLIVE